MALSSVLINPKRLNAASDKKNTELFDVFWEFLESFSKNPEAGGAALQIIGAEFLSGLRDFGTGLFERLRFADGKTRQIFQPLADIYNELLQGLTDSVFDSIPAILTAVRRLLQQSKSDRVSAMLDGFFQLLEDDIGIGSNTLKDLLGGLADRAAVRLQSRLLDGDSSEEAVGLYEYGSQLLSLKQILLEKLNKGPIDRRTIVQAFEKIWREKRLDEYLDILIEVFERVDDLVEPLAAIANIILDGEVSVSTSSTVGAAAADDNTTVTLDTGEDNESNPIAWYATWVAYKVVRFSSDENEPQNTWSNHYLSAFDYKNVSKQNMEKLAFHTAWAAPALEAFFHILSMERGDIFSNLTNVLMDGIDITLMASIKYKFHPAVYWTVKPAATILAALEDVRGINGGNDPYYFTNLGGDFGEMVFWRRWSWLWREATMSFFTLLNHDPEAWARYKREMDRKVANNELNSMELSEYEWVKQNHNHNHFEGIAYLFGEFGSMIYPGVLSNNHRTAYGFIEGAKTGHLWKMGVANLFINVGFTWFGALVGAATPAQEFLDNWKRWGLLPFKARIYGDYKFDGGWWVWDILRMLVSLLMYIIDSWIWLYILTNNNTDDGKYCALPNASETLPDGRTVRFPGYQDDAADSPYLLPFEEGTTQQCVQNHLGIWSHFPETEQTYAVDFGNDAGTEVLCSRAGIVVALGDTIPDNDDSDWNSITILHLIIYPPGSGKGQAAVPLPTTADNKFTNGTAIPGNFQDENGVPAAPDDNSAATPMASLSATAIPNGTLFPPYWDAAGNLTLGFLPPLHPSGSIFPLDGSGNPIPYTAPAPGTDFWDYSSEVSIPPGSTFDFILEDVDKGIIGRTFPAGTAFADGTAIPSDVVFAPDTPNPPPVGTPAFPAGTTFAPHSPHGKWNPSGTLWPSPPAGDTFLSGDFMPMLCTYGVYGHGLFGFTNVSTARASDGRPDKTLTDVFGTNNTNLILGRLIPQGRVIMLSGDTGISAYDHLHCHVITKIGQRWTIPYIYKDGGHDIHNGLWKSHLKNGKLQAMTYYKSQNTRIGP